MLLGNSWVLHHLIAVSHDKMVLVFPADIVTQLNGNKSNLRARASDENEQCFSRATIYGRTLIARLERDEKAVLQLKQRLSMLREELNELLKKDACIEMGKSVVRTGNFANSIAD